MTIKELWRNLKRYAMQLTWYLSGKNSGS